MYTFITTLCHRLQSAVADYAESLYGPLAHPYPVSHYHTGFITAVDQVIRHYEEFNPPHINPPSFEFLMDYCGSALYLYILENEHRFYGIDYTFITKQTCVQIITAAYHSSVIE